MRLPALAVAFFLISPRLPAADVTPGVTIAAFTFDIPAGWEQVPPSSPMRKAELKFTSPEGTASTVLSGRKESVNLRLRHLLRSPEKLRLRDLHRPFKPDRDQESCTLRQALGPD